MFAMIVSFNPLYVALGIVGVIALAALLFLTVTSGLGIGHWFANKKRDSIRRSEAYYEMARMAHNAEAPHFEKFFRADATGSLIGKLHAEHDLLELAKNPALVRKLAINSAEHLLAYEAATPEGRKEVESDLKKLIDQHKGDAVGTFATQVLTLLRGTKDETVVPTVDGKTVTVPTHAEVHYHYHGDAKPPETKPAAKPEEKPKGDTKGDTHIHVYPAGTPAAPPAASPPAAPPAPPTTGAAGAAHP